MKLIQDIQKNCDISDAKDHGIYSMCTMVLKLRNQFKWENALEPWQEPDPGELLDWIDKKENGWEKIAGNEFLHLSLNGHHYHPLEVDQINLHIKNENLVYGAGHGRSWKAVFFLAEAIEQYEIDGIPVQLLGRELAKEMASPFAMSQNGSIIIRRDALRFFLWDQVQELSKSQRASFRHALEQYDVLDKGSINQTKFRDKLDTIVDNEINLFIYHEIGELQQSILDSTVLEKVLTRFPGSAIELVCRTIKDVLADTHNNGLLSYCIREKKETSLSFYLGFLDGLRKMMFPEIFMAWDDFLKNGDWEQIERARISCQNKNNELALKVRSLSEAMDTLAEKDIETMFNNEILIPLGLDVPQ